MAIGYVGRIYESDVGEVDVERVHESQPALDSRQPDAVILK